MAMKTFDILYEDVTILAHAGKTNVALVKFGTMKEKESGEFVIELKDYPNTQFITKEA
jgi:hypothetical protein